MANLSNINGKFVVEQTTGYVGVGTTDPNFLIEAAGVNSEIALNSTSGSIYRLRSTSGDSFIITKNGVGDRLVIDGSGNVEFAGNVGVGNAGTFDNPNSYSKVIEIANSDAVGLILNDTRDSNPMSIDNSGAVMNLRYNTTSMLALDGATSSAIFTGTITSTSTSTNTLAGKLRINGTTTTGLEIASSSGSSSGLKLYNDSSNDHAYILNHYNGNLVLGTNNAAVITLNGTTATFAGSITSQGIDATSLTTPLIQLQGNITILNKAQTSYISFATRDTSGSDTIMDLTNVTINGGDPGPYLPLTGGTLTGNLIISTGKELIIGSQTSAESPLGITIRDDQGNAPVGIVIHNENTGTSADAQIAFETQGAMDFSIGLDRSDSSKFVMSRAGALGTNNVFTIDGTAAIFSAEISSGDDINVNNGKLVVNNTSAEVRIKSTSDTGESFINFSDPSDNNVGQIYYGHGTNKMSIRVNDATRLAIDSSLITFPTVTELRGDVAAKFAIGNMGGASSQMMVSSRGFITLNTSNTGSALDATERMRITSGGQVGIGTPSPQDYDGESDDLVVAQGVNGTNPTPGITIACLANQAATGRGALRFADGTSGNQRYRGAVEYQHSGDDMFFRTSGSIQVAIDSAGNVGIGNTDPSTKLNVANAGEVIVRSSMTAADGYRGGFEADNQHTGGTIWSMFSTNNSDGYLGGGKYVIANESMGGVDANTTAKFVIDGGGSVGINEIAPGTYYGDQLVIACPDENGITIMGTASNQKQYLCWASNSTGSNAYAGFIAYDHNTNSMSFATNGGAGAITIDSAQNVGIGTDSPGRGLTIDKSNANAALTIIKNNTGNEIVYLGTGSSAGTDDPLLRMYHNGTENIRLYATGDSWINGGKVGIGTTSPTAKLHVQSAVNADVIFKLENTNTGTSAGAKIELIDDEGGSGSGAGALRHSISSMSQTVGNWIIESGSSAGQLQFSTLDSFAMIIDENQNVGIGTTSPYSLLDVDGAITNGSATNDSNISTSTTAFSQQDGGALHITWGLGGNAASGSTIVFTYAATSWKSWTLKYNFASTNGITQGVIGGYWNNSGGNQNSEDIDNLGCSAAVTHGGTGNQNIIVTFTFTALGTHPMANFVYMQAGGDGHPRADRVSIQGNNAV